MVSETYDFGPSTTDRALVCAIPSGGVNEPRMLAVDDELPVVLRDPITDQDGFDAFGCKVRKDSPPTPDRLTPDVSFVWGVHGGAKVTMPDGRRVVFYGFYDPRLAEEVKTFPSPLMRVTEGQIVHTTLRASKNTHTIHHHGIEPTPHNDGVGHSSFEVSDTYTYQWRASHAGTYFYHCHKNTVLHFELGMYGPLIIDPPKGEGYVRYGTDEVPYDQEVLWVPDDVDPDWHDLSHQAGLACPWDHSQHLLRFRPRYFMLTGVPHPNSRTDRRVAVRSRVGERLLLRVLNAAYGPIRLTLPFDAVVINRDGHTLGGAEDFDYSWPYTLPAGAPIDITTAQRWDLLVVPDRTGVFTVPIDIKHWVRGNPHGRVETTITVI
jgi:plastocyanin